MLDHIGAPESGECRNNVFRRALARLRKARSCRFPIWHMAGGTTAVVLIVIAVLIAAGQASTQRRSTNIVEDGHGPIRSGSTISQSTVQSGAGTVPTVVAHASTSKRAPTIAPTSTLITSTTRATTTTTMVRGPSPRSSSVRTTGMAPATVPTAAHVSSSTSRRTSPPSSIISPVVSIPCLPAMPSTFPVAADPPVGTIAPGGAIGGVDCTYSAVPPYTLLSPSGGYSLAGAKLASIVAGLNNSTPVVPSSTTSTGPVSPDQVTSCPPSRSISVIILYYGSDRDLAFREGWSGGCGRLARIERYPQALDTTPQWSASAQLLNDLGAIQSQ